jgi:hypothetical protein
MDLNLQLSKRGVVVPFLPARASSGTAAKAEISHAGAILALRDSLPL